MANAQGPKRRHHFLPGYYLKGFSADVEGRYIWEYRRGLPFQPGHIRGRHNPCRVGIRRQAGVEEDFYAFQDVEGQSRFEEVENALEKLEKPVVEVIDKLRSLRPIRATDKQTLAEYVLLMRQRVPARQKRASAILNHVLGEFPWDLLMRKAGDEGRFDLARRIAFEPESMMARVRRELLARGAAVPLANTAAALREMTWSFLVAGSDELFVASDDPVYFPEHLGLNKPEAFLLLPLSSRVSLLAAWIHADDLAFLEADVDLVANINGITLQRAQRYAYGARPEPWIATGLTPEAQPPAT